MKKFLLVPVIVLLIVCVSSCYNNKILVVNVKPTDPVVEVGSEWNHHIIGLIPIGKTKLNAKDYVGDRENYVVKTNQSLVNVLLGCITSGIYTPTTTTFYVPLGELNNK
jgi:hypothetical protein